jgi:hypothetical protein
METCPDLMSHKEQTMDSGNGFHLTDREAHLVYKLVSDAISRSTNETVGREVGNSEAIARAVGLYVRMSNAMQGGRFS